MSRDLSIIIVHYDTPGLLNNCLNSLFSRSVKLHFDVLVIDNNSPNPPKETLINSYKQVRFYFNKKNLGFAAASNQGMRLSSSRYVMLLNSDALIDQVGLIQLVNFMDGQTDAAVVGPKLVNLDGSLQLSCRRFPTLASILLRASRLEKLFKDPVRYYLMSDYDHSLVSQVDWVMGACMLMRRSAVEAVGWLDDNFFMYYEDIDICYRLSKLGWKVYYSPDVIVTHEHQRMSASLLPNRQSYAHISSLFRLFYKHPLPWL